MRKQGIVTYTEGLVISTPCLDYRLQKLIHLFPMPQHKFRLHSREKPTPRGRGSDDSTAWAEMIRILWVVCGYERNGELTPLWPTEDRICHMMKHWGSVSARELCLPTTSPIDVLWMATTSTVSSGLIFLGWVVEWEKNEWKICVNGKDTYW